MRLDEQRRRNAKPRRQRFPERRWWWRNAWRHAGWNARGHTRRIAGRNARGLAGYAWNPWNAGQQRHAESAWRFPLVAFLKKKENEI